eukprot:TRINITY_DN34018_c0_g1_i1.p1 TRINITY_DN34018_c0_g1~~TRINITY_DN34018_c0_g1_i1.p1  ORF type:complete len:748 (+),score=42.29 TRINITY_DN34018_c0_g1_i1:104-2347(+)
MTQQLGEKQCIPTVQQIDQYSNPGRTEKSSQCDYTLHYCGPLSNNGAGLQFPFGCRLQLPWQMDQQSTTITHKSKLVSEGLDVIADQVAKDLISDDIEVLEQALLVCRDLLNGHAGNSRKIIVQALRERQVAKLLIEQLTYDDDKQNLLALQCLSELIDFNRDMQVVIDSGLTLKLSQKISYSSPLSFVIISIFFVLLQSKDKFLQFLITVERADTVNVLITLLSHMDYTNKDALPLLKVLQIILRRSQLAIAQTLQSQGLQTLCRWLSNCKADSCKEQFEVGFQIIVDLIIKHENLSADTKLKVLSQIYQGGLVNAFVLQITKGSNKLTQILYAMSQLCQVQGVSEVVAHLLQSPQYDLLVDFAANSEADKGSHVHASNLLLQLIDSSEGFQTFKSIAVCRGVACLIHHSQLGPKLISKGSSPAGLTILQGLGCSTQSDAVASAEALAAIAVYEPLLCAHVLIHGNLLRILSTEFLQQLSLRGSSPKSSLTNIIFRLFQCLPKPMVEHHIARAWSKSSSVHDRYQSSVQREHTLQSQNSSISTVSSLSQASIPREEVNLKRYDSATFVIGGKELYALGWVMEQHSLFIHKHLSTLKDIKGERIVIPGISGIPDSYLYDLFQLAVEFAYTGTIAQLKEEDVIPLWVLSRKLQMYKLQERCEEEVREESILKNRQNLFQIFQWVAEDLEISCGGRNKILILCIDCIVYQFEELLRQGVVKKLHDSYCELFTNGLADHLRRRLEASMHE